MTALQTEQLLFLRVKFGICQDAVIADTGTVITVPAAFNQMQKDATLTAAEGAGIGRVALIVADEERYAAMGIGFPGGIILEGPTGCGKTYAVERLAEHLGWPSFSIEASSVASPYIHETSRKVAEIFSEAMKAAPAVVIIDEMDAFLASRDSGSHQHNVEEIAEFLRRIPEASANRVLVIGMTNQIDAIDSAILRRGRFDHVIHVDHAGADEVAGLLEALLENIPNNVTDVPGLAQKLSDRPLSDAAFVVREAGRLKPCHSLSIYRMRMEGRGSRGWTS